MGRWTLLTLATLWAVGVALFILRFHINEPHGVLTVTTGGRTFVGNPPALTLYERDGGIWIVALVLIGVVLLSGATELLVRTLRSSTGPGIAAMVAGGLLVAYSLFGLIYGFIGIGTVGVLVILVGLPMKAALGVGFADGATTNPHPRTGAPDA